MATLIQPDGSESEVLPKNGVRFCLEEMQAAVKGYIEPLYLPGGRVMLLNEDGKSLRMSHNERATAIGRVLGIADADHIVGPALICSALEFSDDPEDEV